MSTERDLLWEARGWLESHKYTLNAHEICARIDAALASPTSELTLAGYANGDELDNMLDDRGCLIAPKQTGFRRTPIYRKTSTETNSTLRMLGAQAFRMLARVENARKQNLQSVSISLGFAAELEQALTQAHDYINGGQT